MSVSLSESHPDAEWLTGTDAAEAFASLGADPSMLSWLQETGLLTERLARCCPESFSLQVLRDHGADGMASNTQREVLLCCDGAPCIYAATIIPHATLEAHPWLTALGNDPLGETLQRRPDVSRSEFAYRQFDAELLPAALAGKASGTVWARRSEFRIGTSRLTVTEWFLDALITCDKQRTRILKQTG